MKFSQMASAQLSVSNRFARYEVENETAVRGSEVKFDQALEGILEAWKKYYRSDCSRENKGWRVRYVEAEKSLSGHIYTAAHVEKFCALLIALREDVHNFRAKAGFFLSALVNNGQDQQYKITTRHLKENLRYLCTMNEKHVEIDGDVGEYFAKGMRWGSVTVEGDVVGKNVSGYSGSAAHLMEDGLIEVKGDISGTVGERIYGGRLIVHGDVNGNLISARGTDFLVKGNVSMMRCIGGHVEVGGSVESLLAAKDAFVWIKGSLGRLTTRGYPSIIIEGDLSETMFLGMGMKSARRNDAMIGVGGGIIRINGEFDINDLWVAKLGGIETNYHEAVKPQVGEGLGTQRLKIYDSKALYYES